jgi:hypothetical protein
MPRKGNPDIEDIETVYVAPAETAAKVPRPGQRDESLVKILVLAHCMPVGVVQDPLLDEYGDPVLDDAGQPRLRMVERHLTFRERLMMERWCADIMASEGRRHVEIL